MGRGDVSCRALFHLRHTSGNVIARAVRRSTRPFRAVLASKL